MKPSLIRDLVFDQHAKPDEQFEDPENQNDPAPRLRSANT